MPRTRRLAALIFVLLLVGSSLRPAEATVPVYDYIRWIQDFVQRTYAQVQRAEQIYRAVQQVQAAAKNLESWGHSGEWHDLTGVYSAIVEILNRADTLGYENQSLDALLDETFPGYVIPTNAPGDEQLRLRRALTTTKNLTNTLDHVSRPNLLSQLRLIAAQFRSGSSDGALKALQSGNIFASLQDEEFGRSVQAQLAAANLLTVSHAYDLQEEASAQAALDNWMANTRLPHDNRSFGPVPTNWPY